MKTATHAINCPKRVGTPFAKMGSSESVRSAQHASAVRSRTDARQPFCVQNAVSIRKRSYSRAKRAVAVACWCVKREVVACGQGKVGQ